VEGGGGVSKTSAAASLLFLAMHVLPYFVSKGTHFRGMECPKTRKTTDSCPPPLCSSSKNVKATAMSFVSHPPFPTHDIGIESTAQQAHVPLLLLKNGRTLGLWVCLELPPKGPIEMWSLVLPLK
jgi:hypothetical protein